MACTIMRHALLASLALAAAWSLPGTAPASAVTSAVTSEVLKSCRDAVLSVDPANVAALRAYEVLGYKEVTQLIEGPAVRREAGPGAFMRRKWAAIRGRQYGGELVSV